MKQHSEDFKNQVAELGRQFSSKLIYDDEELIEELYSVTPHFKGNMLKSTMKQLDVETTEDIPIGTEVNYQLGLLVDDEYEWLDYGNYIVYSSEKQEDKGTYKLVCYDKLLNSMVTYDGVEGTFPMTLREYLQAICDKLDIDFGSANDEFANYDRVLPSDRYEGLEEYTYRDVLDEIAQATGSMICLNNDDELVVRYINEGIDNYNTVEGTSFELEDASGGLGSSITKLEGNTTQNGTPTPTSPVEIKTVSGDNEVVVSGKNKYNATRSSVTTNAVTYSGDTSKIYINGTPNREGGRIFFNKTYLEGGTYTFSMALSSGSFTDSGNNLTYLYLYKGTEQNPSWTYDARVLLTATKDNVVSQTFTIAEGGYYYLAWYLDKRYTWTNAEMKYQVEKGNTKTSFEPYISNSYRVDFGGKNLLNNTATTQTINGVTFTVNEDKSVTVNGTASGNAILILNSFTFEENKSYRLSGCPSGGTGSTYKLDAFGPSGLSSDIGTGVTINVAGTRNVRIVIFSGITVNNLTFYPQIEIGTVATQYSPYVSNPIELCKIGNYKDSIFKAITGNPKYDSLDNTTKESLTYGNWYIEKNIGKVVLNGSESGWTFTTNGNAWFISGWASSNNAKTPANNDTLSGSISNYFTNVTRNQLANVTQGIGIASSGAINLKHPDYTTSGSQLSSFTTWLSNNNPIMYYILANPTYEIITNTNLIEQLNNLQNIELIENLCYVDWVGVEKPTMTLRYYQGRTLEKINEEYLKDVNVDFGEKYGPVNSIVLSRSGESDNVYIQDEDSIEENGLHELKIVDNQLMNFNDRSDYLQGLLDKLDGLEYYINDFKSTGICYLELGDRYYVSIGNNTYSCVMFNDEIDITTGLEELVYTEMPEETETDYTKADKTDRRINQTYLIVDKQNQQIQSLVNEVGDRSQKTTTITQDIDGIEELLASTVDVTRDDESYNATVSIAEVNLSEPVEIRVKPTTSPGISYLYPRSNLYPSDTLYMTERKIRFVRTYVEDNITKTQNIDYELPDDLLYYSQNAYDEFVLDYLNKECKIIKKCAYNANGQVVLTGSTETIQYEYPTITLPEGDYEVKILGYNVGYIYARLMIQNEYTKLFTTEVETETSIAIKEREIMANVSQEYETKGEAATQYAQIQVTTDGISSEVANKVGNDEVVSKINQSAEAVSIDASKININGVISANGNFRVDRSGNMTANNGTFTGGKVALYGGSQSNPTFSIEPTNDNNSYLLLGHNFITLKDGTAYLTFNKDFWQIGDIASGQGIQTMGNSSIYFKTPKGDFSGQVYSYGYNTYSKESMKKDFEKLGDVSSIIKNSQLYSYHYKTENDKDKKHIGFVIADEGGDFKTPKEVIINNESIDMYSMCSILWKAVQEQQEKIEELENKLKEEK